MLTERGRDRIVTIILIFVLGCAAMFLMALFGSLLLFGWLVPMSVFGSTTLVNDTTQAYSVSGFGSGDALDGGDRLSEPTVLDPGESHTYRYQDIICIMLASPTGDRSSYAVTPATKEHDVTFRLSDVMQNNKPCWTDLRTLTPGKTYRGK